MSYESSFGEINRNVHNEWDKWYPELFKVDGDRLHYNGKFVARFKHGGMEAFKNNLARCISPEFYFYELDDGAFPIEILNKRGYISPNVTRVLRDAGYPATPAGKKAFLNSRQAPPKRPEDDHLDLWDDWFDDGGES